MASLATESETQSRETGHNTGIFDEVSLVGDVFLNE